MFALRTQVSIALLFAFASCSHVVDRSSNGANGQSNATGSEQQLVAKIIAAPNSISWTGKRHLEAHYLSHGTPTDLVYDETVTTDGHGAFHIVADDLVTPQLSPSAEALFLLSQNRREGFLFRHRDNTVRIEELFLGNYTIADQGATETFVGRDCAVWTIASVITPGETWKLWIDLATGVILKNEERDDQGALVNSLAYLDFTLDPDTSNVVWHVDPVQETPLDPATQGSQLGFAPALPKGVPQGYRLLESTAVVDPTDNSTWARFVYTDGWNELIYMDGGPLTKKPPTQGISPKADVVRTLSIGPWLVCDGHISNHRVLAIGRVSLSSLQALIESALL